MNLPELSLSPISSPMVLMCALWLKGAHGGALLLLVRSSLWRLPQKNTSLNCTQISYNLPVGLPMARYTWQI